MDSTWCADEFEEVNFGDSRLHKRFIRLAEALSHQPLSPINQACEDPASMKAAYRFFANETVQGSEIFKAHQHQVVERCLDSPVLFIIQDTSFIDYTSHIQTSGLGKIGCDRHGTKKGRGLVMHSSLALSEDGLPLGLLDQRIWARSEEPYKSPHERCSKIPIEKKESFKWLKAVRECSKVLYPKIDTSVPVIYLADREADIFEFMEEVLKQKAHFLIRARLGHSRVIIEEKKVRDRRGIALHTLTRKIKESPVQAVMEVSVPSRAANTASLKVPERVAQLEVRFCSAMLAVPRRSSIRRRGKKLNQLNQFQRRDNSLKRALEINAIWVREVQPPEGVAPLDWFLVTDLPIETVKAAEQAVAWYRMRWKIEVFHKILKSGCRVEDCRLGTGERLKKYLTLFSTVAWRILWLSTLNRHCPKDSCTRALSDQEWKALSCRMQKTSMPPADPPTLSQAMQWIARLGGFPGRKNDGVPGTLTLWRGWQRLYDITEDWIIFHPT